MELEQIIEEFKKWCEEHSIYSLNGSNSEGNNPIEIEIEEDLSLFLELAKINSVKQIVIDSDEFDNEIFLEARLKSSTFRDEKLKEFVLPFFESAKKFNGRMHFLKLFWVKDGALYSKTERAEWLDSLEIELEELVNGYLEDKRDKQKDKLLYNEDKQNELIKIIAQSENYLVYSTRPSLIERLFNDIIRNFDDSLEEHEISSLKRIIKSRVENEFENNHRTEAENSLSFKIRDMMDLNRTKVDIIRALNLTDGLFQKYR